VFLAVQNSSIGDLVTHSLTHSVSQSLRVLLLLWYKERPQRPVTFETSDQSDEETWPDQKKPMTKTKTMTKTMTTKNTFREHLQRAIPETCDLWDIWSEWWWDMHQSVTNIFEYLNIRVFLIRIFIRIFVRIIFLIRIYSVIRSYQFFGYEYIRIFVRSNILIQIYSDICSYQFSDSDDVFV